MDEQWGVNCEPLWRKFTYILVLPGKQSTDIAQKYVMAIMAESQP